MYYSIIFHFKQVIFQLLIQATINKDCTTPFSLMGSVKKKVFLEKVRNTSQDVEEKTLLSFTTNLFYVKLKNNKIKFIQMDIKKALIYFYCILRRYAILIETFKYTCYSKTKRVRILKISKLQRKRVISNYEGVLIYFLFDVRVYYLKIKPFFNEVFI